MAAEANEQAKSRKWSPTGGSIGYIVTGTEDPSAAITAAITAAPNTWNGHLLRTPSIDRVIERQSDDIMFITVPYTPPELDVSDGNASTGEVSWSTDVGTETVRVKSSLSTVNTYVPTGMTTPDFGKLVNVSGTGTERKVEGVDVSYPITKITGTFRASSAIVTDSYRNTLENLVGTVSDSIFRSKAVGQVRFDGFTDREVLGRDNYDYELTLRFSVRRNETGISIGSISGIAKDGWDYLWVYYERDEDTTNKHTKPEPRAVFVERVYERADWDPMGAVIVGS